MANYARLSLILCLVAGSYGCRACTSCYDYSSPVANSLYAGQPGRAGSVLSGTLFTDRLERETAIPAPTDMSDLDDPMPGEDGNLPTVEYAVAAEAEPIDTPVGVNFLR